MVYFPDYHPVQNIEPGRPRNDTRSICTISSNAFGMCRVGLGESEKAPKTAFVLAQPAGETKKKIGSEARSSSLVLLLLYVRISGMQFVGVHPTSFPPAVIETSLQQLTEKKNQHKNS